MIAYYILKHKYINRITVINFQVSSIYLSFFPNKFAVKNYRAMYETDGHLEDPLFIN